MVKIKVLSILYLKYFDLIKEYRAMLQKLTILSLVLFFSTFTKAMDFGAMKEMKYPFNRKQECGLLCSAIPATLLIISPENSAIANYLYSAGILIGLDLLGLRKHLTQVGFPLLWASTIAAQTKDANCSISDHIRSLCAGGILYAGLRELVKNVYQQDIKRSLIGLGACALGASLFSYKDIKMLFNIMKGKSLNPSKEKKNRVMELSKIDPNDSCGYKSNIDVPERILKLAQDGKLNAQMWLFRLGVMVKDFFKKDDSLDDGLLISKKSMKEITKLKFVADVLPYLRVYKVKNNNVFVGNGFSKSIYRISKDLLKGYFPEDYLFEGFRSENSKK